MADNSPASRGDFTRVDSSVNLPGIDSRILQHWDAIGAFERSIGQRPPESEYTFYDGPPFASGSPHYGHLLAGVLKDIVPRYWAMRGHRIERRFGWDTHGLPVEMEVQAELGVSSPAEVRELGIDTFNEACRAKVEGTTEDWELVTRRLGRWVDFEDDYKTMDVDFMESVWWVFGELWRKGLVYQAFKVLPYSWGATTPLSNFEANSNYQDVDDPAITMRLEVVGDHGPAQEGDWLLLWTTTPWTLPGNLAVAVGEDLDYARAVVDGQAYWVAAALVESVLGDAAVVTATATGRELLGLEYRPPFDYFGEERDRGAFRVIASSDVNVEEGTGLVHMAPAYGEADFFALQNAGLDVLVDPIDDVARFTDAVPDVAGMYVKDADAVLISLLAESGMLVKREQIRHSYPFCPRTDTPLIYKAIPTWFVRVESLRDRMVEINKTIRWVPESVGTKRFGNWLEGARDWAISRNRYWGSCIPVWECDGCNEQVCVTSRADLHARSGVMVDDLHKHIVDKVTFPCTECEGTMTRVPEVLDCWFESGSMPYAQIHYPFENEERFARRFPADYIAEGLDQTRGWFYTLVVLSTALFDEAPFKNCVVNGMILAEDGRKMSKRLKNYPDPIGVFDEFGADALRAYLINSPLVRAEPLRFSERGVKEVVRTVLLPFWNSYSFFTTYAEADGLSRADLAGAPHPSERHEMDRWVLSVLQSLIRDINREMEEYRLYAVIPPMLGFISDLTNWYIRRSRRRFWSQRAVGEDVDKLAAFATLYEVLTTFSAVAAPVLPFMTDEIYLGLTGDASGSVHLVDYPLADESLVDQELEAVMAHVRTVVNLGRALRKQHELKVRQPLATLTVVSRDDSVAAAVASHADLIAEELNVKSVETSADESGLVMLSAKPDFSVLGPRFGKRVGEVAAAVAAWDTARLSAVLDGEPGALPDDLGTVVAADLVIERTPLPGVVVASEGAVSVALDTELTSELTTEGTARELISRIQGLRRDLGLDVSDRITLAWWSESDEIAAAMATHGDLIASEVLARAIERSAQPVGSDADVNGRRVTIEVRS